MNPVTIPALIGLGLGLNVSASAEAPIRVVASTLDMAEFARQVGGDRVTVHAITRGQYDLHAYEPRPSEVLQLKRAELLIVSGMELDAFMPGLIDASRNPAIRFGAPGFVDPSVGVAARDVPTGKITGEMGDVHAYGNPHYWFSAENVAIAVNNIAAGLIRVSPADREAFEARRDAYLAEVRAVFARLTERMAQYRGVPVVQYHASWDYFCETMGLELIGAVEPKPGIPPSAAHLANLVAIIKQHQVPLVLAEPFYPEKPLRFLQAQTPISVLRPHLLLCDADGPATYLENLTGIVDQIAAALDRSATP